MAGDLLLQQAWVCRTASEMYFALPAARRLCLHWRGYPCGTGCSLQDQVHESETASISADHHAVGCQQRLWENSLLSAAVCSSACQGHRPNQSCPDLTCQAAVLPRLVKRTVANRRCLHQGLSTLALQDAVGDESADQVSVNFFGDGTCNMGEASQFACLTWPQPCSSYLVLCKS